MLREHYSKRTTAPQPQLLILAVVWVIALICLNNGSRPKYAWSMVACATILTLYIAARFWRYYAALKSQKPR